MYPTLQARKIVDILSQGLPVRHAYVGVQVATITPELARQHNSEPGSKGGVPEVRGVLVAKVKLLLDRKSLQSAEVCFQ